ncbi:MAG: hydrogenase nickel incorporation protein HypB [Clostridiales bacterium]|nr:hydrogenase nickel incorporation protein HypB [Candidatus Crickella equi]
MGNVRTITINESIFANNDIVALENREKMTKNGTFFINVMSGPGAGKTTVLTRLINMLKDEYKIGEMDVDIKSTLDAQTVADATGVKSMQIHNGGLCHIDADMTARALEEYSTEDLDLLIMENIGNMVCPAEFDTGAHKNVMLWSITEGDDKPLKYPLMFTVSDVILINKIDAIDYFDFDFELAEHHIRALNPDALIFRISGNTGEGMDAVAQWVRSEIERIKK